MAATARDGDDQPIRNIEETLSEAVKAYVTYRSLLKIIKGCGWTSADFSLLCKLYQAEQEARDATITRLRIGFRALSMGQQLDWIDAVESGRQEEPVETESPPVVAANGRDQSRPDQIARMGYEAGLKGADRDSNPLPEKSGAYNVWDQNYLDGMEDRAKGLAGDADSGGPAYEDTPLAEAIVTRPRRGRPPKEPGAPTAPYTRKKEDEALFH
jgi:hypothetical protein